MTGKRIENVLTAGKIGIVVSPVSKLGVLYTCLDARLEDLSIQLTTFTLRSSKIEFLTILRQEKITVLLVHSQLRRNQSFSACIKDFNSGMSLAKKFIDGGKRAHWYGGSTSFTYVIHKSPEVNTTLGS